MEKKKKIIAIIPSIVGLVSVTGGFWEKIEIIQSGNIIYGIMILFLPPIVGIIVGLTFLRIYEKFS